MIGRNNLCPCGSGKKYKKCCLQKNQLIEFTKNKAIYAKGLYRNIENKVIAYSNQSCFDKERETCKNNFYISDISNNKIDKLFKTYFVYDYITEDKKVIATKYVEENQMKLNKTDSNILIGMLNSYISLYKVELKNPTNIVIKDCFTDESFSIEDIEAFKSINVGDSIIARFINIQGMNIFVDTTINISEKNKKIIVDNIKTLYKSKEKTINNIKEYITYHSDIIYKYVQQLLLNDDSYIVETQEHKNNVKNDLIEEKNNQLDIYHLLKDNIEEEYLEQGIELWKTFIKARKSITGSENGWAAAVEYYIKKNAGEAITQVQISQKYEVSPRTLGKRYKELRVS